MADQKKAETKGPSDSDRIDAIIALLEKNGFTIPKSLK
jgi:hypothetical protein